MRGFQALLARVVLIVGVVAGIMSAAPAGALPGEEAANPSDRVGDVVVSPPAGIRLNWPPSEIVLRFPGPADGVDVVLSDADGHVYPPVYPPEVDGSVVRFPPPQLGAGTFTVAWSGPFAGSYEFALDVTAQVESIGPSGADGTPPPGPSPTADGGSLVRMVGVPVLVVLAVLLLVKVRPRRLGALVAVGMLGLSALMVVATAAPPASGADRAVCLGHKGQERIDCLTDVAFAGFQAAGVTGTLEELRGLAVDPRFVSEYGEHVCHTVAHQVARLVVAEVGSLRRVVGEGDTTCASGFLHGAVEGGAPLVTTDVFVSETKGLCGDASDEDALECAHGIGHGAALRLNSRLLEASDVCIGLGNEPQAVQCVLGVSMLSGIWTGNMAARSQSFADASPPGVPAGSVGEPCLDERFTASAERFRACLEGIVFYTKVGPEVLERFPETWRTAQGVAAWCGEVATRHPELAAACFWGVGTGSALRIWDDPSVAAVPCAAAPTAEAEESCVIAAVTQIRNNQAESPPPEVFEQVCSVVSEELAERCRLTADRLVNRPQR